MGLDSLLDYCAGWQLLSPVSDTLLGSFLFMF